MVQENINVVPTGPLIRALPRNSFDTVPISYPLIQATEPADAQTSNADVPGSSWDVGKDGRFTPQRIMLLPYAEGPAGSLFWLRLFGWLPTGFTATGTPGSLVWVPILLAHFACRAGAMPGPTPRAGFQSVLAMSQVENLCDALWLLNGRLGPTGTLASPGDVFAAYALVELNGVQKISFEFQAPEDNVVGMNAWWARR